MLNYRTAASLLLVIGLTALSSTLYAAQQLGGKKGVCEEGGPSNNPNPTTCQPYSGSCEV